MAVSSNDKPTKVQREETASLGVGSAPFVYFDGVPAFGAFHGAIQIELSANAIVPDGKGSIKAEAVTVARLRCSPVAALALRKAIDDALLLITPAAGEGGTGQGRAN